jgi:hypothetical protein
MQTLKLLGFVLAIAFGGFMIAYGEMDDSPGGQLLGLVALIIGIVGVTRNLRNSHD